MTSTIAQLSSQDPEKAVPSASNQETPLDSLDAQSLHDPTLDIEEPLSLDRFAQWAHRIEILLRIEARGIHRVKANEQSKKSTLSFLHIVILWFSLNTASQNITLASIGLKYFGLGFKDASICSILGAVIGTIPVAWTATWGPMSGNRTLVCARFSMGWWPVKLCVLLNLVILLGYSMIGAVVAGQMLSAVAPQGRLTVEAGIIIAAVLTFLITTFGIKTFHQYERYASIPQIIVLLILAGTAGPHFDISTLSRADDYRTLIGNRISFFSLCFSSAITYAPLAADLFVYCDPKVVTEWTVFSATMIGLSLSFAFTFTLGCGLASGQASYAPWGRVKPGTGALVVAGYDGLGAFGNFCAVVAAMGLISNMVPPVYCCGIDVQILGRYVTKIPRFIWNAFGVVVLTVCGLAGRDHLSEIFMNFLALMGYWVVLWIVITVEEQLIFRRRCQPAFVWSDWNKPEKLPIGLAAFIAFAVGWVGAVLSMAQVYYHGPIAKLVGKEGADMGNYIGFVLAGFVYPPLRYLELKKYER